MAKAQKKSVRIDPPQRPIDGAIPFFDVVDKDPTREYVWVYKAAPGQDFGVEHYEYQGWEMECYREGGPRPRIVLAKKIAEKNGQPIEVRGNVLMSIAKERHQEIVQKGDDGVSGQEAADRIDHRLLDRTKHVKDAMRGINPRLRNGDTGIGVEFDQGSAASIPVGEDE